MSFSPDAPGQPRTVVHMLRHGEVHNPGRILYGRLPGYHLSDLGARMAQMVADHLSDNDVSHVIASPLDRARETAAPIAAAHGLEVEIDDRVIESGNDFEGYAVAGGQGLTRHPHMWRKMLNPLRPSWGEPYVDVAARMRLAIADARVAARGHEAVIVSHQSPIWLARLDIEGRRLPHDPRKRECALASLTTLTYVGDRLLSLAYSEPAAPLLPQAQPGAGA